MTRNPHPAPRRTPAFTSTTIRFASLVLVFITILALGAVAYFTEREIAGSRDWVIHTYQVRSKLNDLQLEVTRAENDETTYLLTQGKQQLPQSREQSDLARQTVDELRTQTRDNPRQQQRLQQLGRILNESNVLLESLPDSGAIRVQLSPSERRRQEAIGDREKQMVFIVRRMQDEEESLLAQRLKAWDYLFKRNVLMLALAFAVVTLMLGYNFRLLMTEVAQTKVTEKRSRAQCGILSFNECQDS